MISQYATTNQGKETRSLIVAYLTQHPNQEFSREDLVRHCELSYDQVRRQTKNLCIEGQIKSRIEAGKRVYRLRRSAAIAASGFLVALLGGWGIALKLKNSENQHGLHVHHSHHNHKHHRSA